MNLLESNIVDARNEVHARIFKIMARNEFTRDSAFIDGTSFVESIRGLKIAKRDFAKAVENTKKYDFENCGVIDLTSALNDAKEGDTQGLREIIKGQAFIARHSVLVPAGMDNLAKSDLMKRLYRISSLIPSRLLLETQPQTI